MSNQQFNTDIEHARYKVTKVNSAYSTVSAKVVLSGGYNYDSTAIRPFDHRPTTYVMIVCLFSVRGLLSCGLYINRSAWLRRVTSQWTWWPFRSVERASNVSRIVVITTALCYLHFLS